MEGKKEREESEMGEEGGKGGREEGRGMRTGEGPKGVLYELSDSAGTILA